MTLFFYDLLQPLAFLAFRATVMVLRTFGIQSGKKLIETLEIRTINGRPAFESIQTAKFLGQKPVWIHAASGEFEYAKPIVRELQKIGRPVFVTYFSPTYQSNIESFNGVTASCALPLEDKSQLRQLIRKVRPAALLIARTDTWPNMVRECSNANVPVLLFSATFHAGSKRIGLMAKALTRATYEFIDEIQCVSTEDLAVLSKLGYERGVSRGDTRYDQVLERLNHPKSVPEKLRPGFGDCLLTAGSVWEEDVAALLPAIVETKNALNRDVKFSCLIVPHEISTRFTSAIKTQAESYGLKTTILSKLEAEQDYDVVIVDRIGILAELYMLGQLAFVGGSFKKTVHSVMEPLAAGCLTFVGPLHTNNREALEFQSHSAHGPLTSVTAVKDASGLASTLTSTVLRLSQMTNSERSAIKDQIQNKVRSKCGATEAVLSWISRNQKI